MDPNATVPPSGDQAGSAMPDTSGATSTRVASGPSESSSRPNPDVQHVINRRSPSGDQIGCATVSMPSVTATTCSPVASMT